MLANLETTSKPTVKPTAVKRKRRKLALKKKPASTAEVFSFLSVFNSFDFNC